MEVFLNLLLLFVALAVLLKSSDWFVDGAEKIGLSFGISPFIIGLTIVAFGTSLPELATSIAAVLDNTSEIVVGNVVGSNITNIALVLGLVSVISKQIDLEYNIWHIDMPYLWGSAFLLFLALRDLHISYFEAGLFLVGIVIFLAYSFKGDTAEKSDDRPKASWRSYAMLVVGGALVAISADFTIRAISQLSAQAGIDPEIIAISAVALGTSLPEIIVSINAARKGMTSIAVGNVLGSNIFNTFVVMSIPRFFGDLVIPASVNVFFVPVMIIMTILFGIMANNKKITRWEGCVLLLFYAMFLSEVFKEVA